MAPFSQELEPPQIPGRFITDGTPSTAYKEEGLAEAMDALIRSVRRKSGNRFESPLLPSKNWFNVKGLSAITDKK